MDCIDSKWLFFLAQLTSFSSKLQTDTTASARKTGSQLTPVFLKVALGSAGTWLELCVKLNRRISPHIQTADSAVLLFIKRFDFLCLCLNFRWVSLSAPRRGFSPHLPLRQLHEWSGVQNQLQALDRLSPWPVLGSPRLPHTGNLPRKHSLLYSSHRAEGNHQHTLLSKKLSRKHGLCLWVHSVGSTLKCFETFVFSQFSVHFSTCVCLLSVS